VKGARVDNKPTLASQGIDKNLAQQGRVLGALSDQQFEQAVEEKRVAVIAPKPKRAWTPPPVRSEATKALEQQAVGSIVRSVTDDMRKKASAELVALRDFYSFTILGIRDEKLKLSGDVKVMSAWRGVRDRVEPFVKIAGSSS
jgi:hypothetical protein